MLGPEKLQVNDLLNPLFFPKGLVSSHFGATRATLKALSAPWNGTLSAHEQQSPDDSQWDDPP
jgi:hypothetical protein